jgi:Ca-activated chloride channel homolog
MKTRSSVNSKLSPLLAFRRLGLATLLGLLIGGVAAGATVAGDAAPPEPPAASELLRLWNEGASWLFPAEEVRRLRELSAPERAEAIAELLADPTPETPGNQLLEAIARRRALLFDEVLTLTDQRGRLLFLHGPPERRERVECSVVFVPLEIWSYGEDRLVLYRPGGDGPYRLWLPLDSKRALYTREMGHLLDEWHQRPAGARLMIGRRVCSESIDRCLCTEATRVDRATGVARLQEARPDAPVARELMRYLQPPEDLAAWAREVVGEGPAPLEAALTAEILEASFSGRRGQRMDARLLVVLPEGAPVVPFVDPDEETEPELRINVEGVVESEGELFDTFRMRFVLPPPAPGVPLALEVQRSLRPGSYRLRLRLRDEIGGAEAVVSHDLHVPAQPRELLAPEALAGLAPTERLDRQLQEGPDGLVLLIPPRDIVFATVRAHAVVQGPRIQRVSFLVDGVPQLTRTAPPFTVDLRLARFPREQTIRAEGYDDAGELVAADQVNVNQIRGDLEVAILSPSREDPLEPEMAVRVQVVVPEERQVRFVELSVNDVFQARLEEPPWESGLRLPVGEELIYVTAVAELDDGRRAEDVRFLVTPPGLEAVDVDLVELYTTVTDRGGGLVEGLGMEDFRVLEDGRPQRLEKVELVRDLPLMLGFTIDVSGSMHQALGEAQRAAEAFLHQVLSPRDRCFVAAFSSQPSVVMPRTSDVFAAIQAVHRLEAGGWTSLYDAIVYSLYYFQGTRGRRALVLLSDGADNTSYLGFDDALTYARESGVVVYAIALQTADMDLTSRRQLERLSRETGGRYYHIASADELAGVYRSIEQELRSQYLLAYSPDRPLSEGGYRRVEVEVDRRGATARTAAGYVP